MAPRSAALAQLVEHIIRNDGARCSSHLSGTTAFPLSLENQQRARFPQWGMRVFVWGTLGLEWGDPWDTHLEPAWAGGFWLKVL